MKGGPKSASAAATAATESDGAPLLALPPHAKRGSKHDPADQPPLAKGHPQAADSASLGRTLGRTTTAMSPDLLKQTLGRTATSMEPDFFFQQTLARSPTGARTDLLRQTLGRADTNTLPDFLRQTLARTATNMGSGLLGKTLGRTATGVPWTACYSPKWGVLPTDDYFVSYLAPSAEEVAAEQNVVG